MNSQTWVLQWYSKDRWRNWNTPSLDFQEHVDAMLRGIKAFNENAFSKLEPVQFRVFCLDTEEYIMGALFE